MRVYLLFVEKYDNQPAKLKGVFSSEEKANICKGKYYSNSRAYVEEHVIDKKINSNLKHL